MKHTSSIPEKVTFQARVIEYNGTNIAEISMFIKQYGSDIQSVLVARNSDTMYLMYVKPWNNADEENPQKGDRYCIHPDKQCYIYTSGEFEANFKSISQ